MCTFSSATEHGLCKGLERGIGKMTRNEKSRFKVKAGEFGYTAEQRVKLNIPDNTDVQFLVHLQDFERVCASLIDSSLEE